MELDVEKILDILGNKTRRKLLEKLSEEAGYVFQLSEDINSSRHAISKHLDLLKKMKIITSFERASDLGGPPRRYFKITKSFSIMLDVTPDSFEVKLLDYDETDEKYPKIAEEIKNTVNSTNPSPETLSKLKKTLEKINFEINELENRRQYLNDLRQQIIRQIKIFNEQLTDTK
ncbi:MAG: ArsR family transcriptional regulator [Promethearchaeota archaeon]